MKNIFPLKAGALALGLLLLGGCEKNSEVDASITNTVVTNPDFQTLEDAAIRGDVAILLGNKNTDPQSQGNFTVFAPTNAAFVRLGLKSAQDLTALQQPFLHNTLLYHVFSGTLLGSALTGGSTSPSALGLTRRIIRRADDTYVNGSKILATDAKASNGLVHPIDKVLLATGADVVASAQYLQTGQAFVKPELTFLVAAVVKCNLQGLLSQPGPYTVFAPTDQAFIDAGIPSVSAINAMNAAQVAALTGILANHVLAGSLGNKFTPELPDGTAVTSFGGGALQLGAFTNGALTVKSRSIATPANMAIPDVQCTNGVVHVIDRVLLP